MISDYSKEKLVNLFNWNVKEENIEDIVWTLRYTKVVTMLYLGPRNIEVEGERIISEVLKVNTTLQILD